MNNISVVSLFNCGVEIELYLCIYYRTYRIISLYNADNHYVKNKINKNYKKIGLIQTALTVTSDTLILPTPKIIINCGHTFLKRFVKLTLNERKL